MGRNLSVLLSAVVALVGAQGCSSDPVGPSVPMTMELDTTVTLRARSAIIEVIASPHDTTLRLAPDQRLTGIVRTSGGDEEELVFRRYICGWQICHSFLFTMESGHNALEVVDLAPAINARVVHVGIFGDWGAVTVLSGPIEAAMDRARRWPGVRSVNQNGVGCIAIAGINCPPQHLLEAVIATDSGAVRGHDGLLQTRAGENVTFTYTQPDGTTLSRTAVWNPAQ